MKKLLCILLVLGFLVPSVFSQDKSTASRTNLLAEPSTLTVTGGVFLPHRKDFRTVYGSGISGSAILEFHWNDKFSYGMRTKLFHKIRSGDARLTYWSLSIAPVLFYSFKGERFRFPSGISAGLCYQRASAEFDEDYILFNDDYTVQTDFSFYVAYMLGAEYAIAENVNVGLLLTIDKMYTRDPSLGHLGDNGGLSIDLYFRIDI